MSVDTKDERSSRETSMSLVPASELSPSECAALLDEHDNTVADKMATSAKADTPMKETMPTAGLFEIIDFSSTTALQSEQACDTPDQLHAVNATERSVNAAVDSAVSQSDFGDASSTVRAADRESRELVDSERTLMHKIASIRGSGDSDAAQVTEQVPALPSLQTPTTPVEVSAWVEKALAAAKNNNKRNPLTTGDALIILDTADLSKARLVPSSTLFGMIPRLSQPGDQSESIVGGSLSGELSCLLVLGGGENGLPKLISRPLNHEPASAADRDGEDQRTLVQQNVKVEAGLDKRDAQMAETDWAKAYESFFRLLCKKGHGLTKQDFEGALPQITGIVAIAADLDAIHVVQETLQCLFFGYIGKHTFWKAIAKYPLQCVNLAVTLRNATLYEEALKHVVGSSADCVQPAPDMGKIQPIIDRKVQTLRTTRIEIDIQLLGLSILAKIGDDTTPANMQHAVMWTTINLHRDWMAEHINYLRSSANKDEGPSPSRLCNHDNGCMTVAGFYRVVAMGDDSYLRPGNVLHQWNTTDFPKKGEAMVTKSLTILKRKAADLVAPLMRSTLQLPDKDELEYLTCVQVGKEDIPWDTEADGDVDSDEAVED